MFEDKVSAYFRVMSVFVISYANRQARIADKTEYIKNYISCVGYFSFISCLPTFPSQSLLTTSYLYNFIFLALLMETAKRLKMSYVIKG